MLGRNGSSFEVEGEGICDIENAANRIGRLRIDRASELFHNQATRNQIVCNLLIKSDFLPRRRESPPPASSILFIRLPIWADIRLPDIYWHSNHKVIHLLNAHHITKTNSIIHSIFIHITVSEPKWDEITGYLKVINSLLMHVFPLIFIQYFLEIIQVP